MATISSIGIGSGLDIESVITQLVAVERAPVDQAADGGHLAADPAVDLRQAAVGHGGAARRGFGTDAAQHLERDRRHRAATARRWPSPPAPAAARQLLARGAAPGLGAVHRHRRVCLGRRAGRAKARCASNSAPGAPGRPRSRPRPAPRRWTSPSARRPTSLAQVRDKINASNSGVVGLGAHRRQRRAPGAALGGHRRGQRLSRRRHRHRWQQLRRRRPVGAGLRPVGRHPDDGPGAGRGQCRRQPERPADRLGEQHAVERARRHDADAGQGDHRAGAGRGQAGQRVDPQGAGQLRHAYNA